MDQPTQQKSILPLSNGTYYLPIRQDFIALCENCEKDEKSHASAYCMALILAVMEKWTNEKIKNKVSLYVTMTYPQWVNEIYGMFKRNTIIDSLQVLVANNLLQREAFHPSGGGKDQYKYLLNVELIKNKLDTMFKNQLCQSPKSNERSTISNFATSENQLRERSNSSSTKFEKGRFKEDTSHYIESTKEEERCADSQPIKPASVQSVFSLEEKQILDWYEKLNTGHKTKTEKAQEILPDFLQHVHSFEDMQKEHDYTAKRLKEEGKADQTVYMATMRYYMLKRLKEKPAQPELDMSEKVLWSRYGHLPNFETSVDLWFLFEYMTRMEALNYGIANNGELFGKKLYAIEDQLKASDEATKRGLIEQWLAEKQGVQSLKIAG